MEYIKLDNIDNLEQVMKRIARATGKGAVICYPTDTVYGLGTNAFNAESIGRIYNIKKREENHPFSIIIGKVQELKSLISEMQLYVPPLIDKFWPGGLTLIFKSSDKIKASIPGKRDTIGIRLPDSKICNLLSEHSGVPLISTSANLSGSNPPQSIGEIPEEILNRCDIVIDLGTIDSTGSSTVIDVSSDIPKLLRSGVIPADEIKKYCSILLTS